MGAIRGQRVGKIRRRWSGDTAQSEAVPYRRLQTKPIIWHHFLRSKSFAQPPDHPLVQVFLIIIRVKTALLVTTQERRTHSVPLKVAHVLKEREWIFRSGNGFLGASDSGASFVGRRGFCELFAELLLDHG